MSQCNSIFTDQSIFRNYSRKITQFQSTWARFGKDKTIRLHVNMSTSYRNVNISPCLWLQLVTEIPVGIWIRDKFKLKIDRFVKTPWQECREVASSLWWAPASHAVFSPVERRLTDPDFRAIKTKKLWSRQWLIISKNYHFNLIWDTDKVLCWQCWQICL